MKKLLLTLTIFLFSSSLYAFQTPDFLNGFYGGVGYNYNIGGYDMGKVDYYASGLKTNYKHIPNIFVGYKFNDYFSMDFQYNQSLKANRNLNSTNVEIFDVVSSNGSNKAQSIIQSINFYYPINEHHKPFVSLGFGIQKITNNQHSLVSYYHEDVYLDKKEVIYSLVYKLGLGYEYTLNNNSSFVLNTNALITNYEIGKINEHEYDLTALDLNGKSIVEKNKFQATYNIGVAYKYTFDNR